MRETLIHLFLFYKLEIKTKLKEAKSMNFKPSSFYLSYCRTSNLLNKIAKHSDLDEYCKFLKISPQNYESSKKEANWSQNGRMPYFHHFLKFAFL